MSDTTEIEQQAEESEQPAAPAEGLYIFYDGNKDIQIGVSGEYTIGEAILMLGAARSKLELLQYHAAITQRDQEQSRIVVPA